MKFKELLAAVIPFALMAEKQRKELEAEPYILDAHNVYSGATGYRNNVAINHGNAPIFISRRTKFKGYMRENRRCTFNKNK
jgi:hypothetical protein